MGYLFLAVALVLNATANILLKIGTTRLAGAGEPGLAGRLLTNLPLLLGLALFALNVAFYVAALARLNLSVAYPVMMAGGVVIVVTVSALFLREAISVQQMIGLSFLVVGLVLVTGRPWV